MLHCPLYKPGAVLKTLPSPGFGPVAAADAGNAGLVTAGDSVFYDYFDGIWEQIFDGVTATDIERVTITENAVVTSKDDQLALADGAATAYIKATRLGIDSYYRPLAEEIVSNMNKGLILDLGTGPGYLPVEIVKKAPEVNIIAIDLSRRLIKEGRANAVSAGVDHQLTFEVGDASRLRFKDNNFDMVITTGMLHSLKNPVGVFREIYRVLKKGGQAWVFDPANIFSYHGKKEWKASLAFHEKFFLWLFTSLGIHQPAKPLSFQRIRSIIEATDFKDYQIENLKKEVRRKMKK